MGEKSPEAPRRRPAYQLRGRPPMPWRPTARTSNSGRDSWTYEARDMPPGLRMVECFKPFLRHLLGLHLSRKTLRRHRDNLWLLGGEVISDLHKNPRLRKRPMEQVVARGHRRRRWAAHLPRRVRRPAALVRFDLPKVLSLPQRRYARRLKGGGHVDNARALPTCPPPQQQQKTLTHYLETGDGKTPHQGSAARMRGILAKLPTDSAEEAYHHFTGVAGSAASNWARCSSLLSRTILPALLIIQVQVYLV